MATGLIGTLTALVLGLLIASAKTSFDQKTSQVKQMTARVILLDDLLAQYGPEAAPAPASPAAEHSSTGQSHLAGGRQFERQDRSLQSSSEASAFENELERLSAGNDAQRSLLSRAIQAFTEGARIRLQLFTQTGGSIPTPFLVILVFWLSAIFVSFTLFARANMVVTVSLFVCALSFSCAVFLVLELDKPFTGLMGISSTTLRSVLLPLPSS